ncbi:hypothetical protein DXC95_20405 [Parabacteroides sp. 20_3]|nr:hypothetical protein DXC95_20405 [Parabacteroides sp. 20_3]
MLFRYSTSKDTKRHTFLSVNQLPSFSLFLLLHSLFFLQLEILSAALNALPGRSRDRVTPKS